MKKVTLMIALMVQVLTVSAADSRQLVEFPAMMQEHMLANMRDHLLALDEILGHLGSENYELATEVAEQRLGMSSLDDHGASHMAAMMPEGMQLTGTSMHKAASRFARIASEGEPLPAYQALKGVTSACVACHSAYRIR